MKLVLIRHARAVERALLQRDRARALTPDGRRRMRRAGRGLATLVPRIDVLATSPLVRARQTAEIVAGNYPDAPAITPLTALVPGHVPRTVLAWLRDQPPDATVALVGHEPDLGRLAGWLLTGRAASFVRFKKGAAALLEFTDAPRARTASLVWLLSARQLAGLD